MGVASTIPYCGEPPDPETLWVRWNLDPILLTVLALILAIYFLGVRRTAIAPWRRAAFAGGWFVLTAALISPLCPLSVSLFSARVGQHMILSLIAAPLLVLGRPEDVLCALWARPRSHSAMPHWTATQYAVVSTLAFTSAIWFWHAPGPYDATFTSDFVYWLMHLTVIGSALMVWGVLLDFRPERTIVAIACGAVSTLQMTLLGALITLTPRALYAPHILTPYAWGLTQASDQQLGGLIMWVPGCTVFLCATLVALGRTMSERAQPAPLV